MNNQLLLYIVGWLASVIFLYRVSWRITCTWTLEGKFISKGTLKSLLRAFAAAYAFTPTVVIAGFVGVPMPASFFLANLLIRHPTKFSYVDVQNVRTAISLLLVVWLIAFVVHLVMSARRGQ